MTKKLTHPKKSHPGKAGRKASPTGPTFVKRDRVRSYSLPRELVKIVDAKPEKTRSAWVAEAIREKHEREEEEKYYDQISAKCLAALSSKAGANQIAL